MPIRDGWVASQCNADGAACAGAHECRAGSYSTPDKRACAAWPAGFWSQQGAGGCSMCAAGTFSAGNGTACSTCPPGRIAALDGAGACSECPPGRTSGLLGGVKCIGCTSTQYLLDIAVDIQEWQCLACPEGAACGEDCNASSVRAKFGMWRSPLGRPDRMVNVKCHRLPMLHYT